VIRHDSDLLSFHRYKKTDKLIVGRFDVMEPDNNYECMPDVIFVPCLAFDLSGHRLGYGGGYYDKTLSYFNSLKRTFTVVGLAYDNQQVDEVIHDDQDQKLNYILTEKQLYKIL
jgi:5-formyltetrahydrofolate cyclo-ligase